MAVRDKEALQKTTRLPAVHVGMFGYTEGVTPPTLGNKKMLMAFFGRVGMDAATMIRKGSSSQLIMQEYGDGLKDEFEKNVQDRFVLPETTDVGEFFMRAQSEAVQTIDSVIGKALPDHRHALGVVNGVRRFSSDPTRFFVMVQPGLVAGVKSSS
jgi:hypothetical protein